MLLLSRNYVFRVDPINRDYSGPSERVRLVPCRLTCDYPTKEFRLYSTVSSVSTVSAVDMYGLSDSCNFLDALVLVYLFMKWKGDNFISLSHAS